MKWEEAVLKSQTGWAIRYKSNKKPTIVNREKKTLSDTGNGTLCDVSYQANSKFDDWEPLSKRGWDKLNEKLPEAEEHSEHGLQIINSLKQFSSDLSEKGVQATLEDMHGQGLVHLFRMPSHLHRRDRDGAIASIATLAAKFVDKDIEYARMATDLLANFLAE